MATDSAQEPFGASFHPRNGVLHFTLLSRGDRVRGVLISTSDGDSRPLVLVISPDGSAGHPLVAELSSDWQDWAVVASIDLPLCGARRSEKLSRPGLDPAHPIGRQIRGDLEAQIQSDLERTVDLLADQDGVDGSRVACLALGLGAGLLEGWVDQGDLFRAFECSSRTSPEWLSGAADRIRERLEG